MTGQQIKDLAEVILDDGINDELFLGYLNTAKDVIEDGRDWEFLKALDTTHTAGSGSKALPTAFRKDRKVLVGTGFQEYFPVPYEQQHAYRNTSRRYYVDYTANTFELLGNIGATGSIYLYYIKSTPELTLTTSPVWPERFHKLLAYMVAAYVMGGVDADDIFARMSPENKLVGMQLLNAMTLWDTNIKVRSQNNRIGVADTEPELSLGDMG
jgi:hypothetical protein